MASPHQVPRARQAAQEQAELLARQVIVGWGKDHEFTKIATHFAGRLKAANLVYEPGNE